MSREDEIRQIARHIWEEEGRGPGHADEHWSKAVSIWEERQKHKNGVWKRILKASSVIAVLVFALGFIPQFMLLLLNIDDPRFNRALANLALGGISASIFVFVAIFLICCAIVGTAALWRRRHPQVGSKDKRSTSTEIKLPATRQDSASQAIPVAPATRRFLYMLTGGISGFIYTMYYVGRAYYEGFYVSVGIPKSFIHYDLQDYIYLGAQIDTILITGAFTAVLIGLLLTRFIQPTGQRQFTTRFENRFLVLMALGYLVLYDLALVLFAYLQIYRPDLVVKPPFVIGILMSCAMTLGLLVMILYFDHDMLSRIRNGRTKRSIFIAGAIVTLFFAPYMSGEAWGAYKGQIIKVTDFPKVELYANRRLSDDIKWVTADNITYKSNQELYLVVRTTEYVVLKSTDNVTATYVLNPSDILSTNIIGMGKAK